MVIFKSDRVKANKSFQANHQVSIPSIITQLETVRNQISTHSGEVENSVDVLARLREGNKDNRSYKKRVQSMKRNRVFSAKLGFFCTISLHEPR